MKRIFIALCLCAAMATAAAQSAVRPIPYGNMDQWVTRNIQESRLIGGQHKRCYAIGPTATIEGDKPYNPSGGSPWATSNVMAKVMGITKVSNAVFPDTRGSGKCARLTTIMENCKAIGLINIDVLVAGTMFLGRMLEPVKSTSDPYGKMEMGIPFDGRPSALVYDYKLHIPANGGRIYSSGFGKKKNLPGTDKAEVFIILQRRWEDSQGNIHARRVGTGRELMAHSTPEWVDGHELTVHYGDISSESFFRPYMGLIPESKSISRSIMLILVKAVGVLKMRMGCTKIQSFLVHHIYKAFLASSDILRDHRCVVITGMQDQTAQKIIQRKLVSHLKTT